MADTRCASVRLLDLRGLSPICDFLIVANGTSARQMRSVIDDVHELAEERGARALTSPGLASENWIVLDLVDLVVHLFTAESRIYYDLDGMWADAPQIDWKQTEPAKEA
jgi:ribosome-associated protein